MPTSKSVLQALRLIAGADPETVRQLVDDELDMIKARGRHAEDLRPGEIVTDYTSDFHRLPSRREIAIGPTVEASGDTRRMAEIYDENLASQDDPTSRLGRMLELLESGLRSVRNELEKAEKRHRDRMQDTYPRSAEGRNGGAEYQPEGEPEDDDEREREKASKAVDIAAALRGESPLEMNIRAFFNAVVGKGFTLAKSNFAASAIVAVEKAVAAGALAPLDAMTANDLLMHAEVVSAGAYPAWQFARELSNAKPELASVLAKAIRP